MKHKNKKQPISSHIDTNDDPIIKKHIFYLIISSLFAKIFTIFVTLFIFGSSIDYFDLRTYVTKSIYLANGQLPYISFYHEYPILAIVPNMIAIIPSMIFNNLLLTFSMFQLIMILLDVVTTICIYYIALKIYNNKTTAFTAGIIYTLSLSVAYTCLTRFDSFPVFLMMISIYLIVCRKNYGGYIGIMLGFFTKVFPIIALPFLILYESKQSLFKDTDNGIDIDILKKRVGLNIVLYGFFSFILVIPFIFIVGLDKAIKPYMASMGSTANFVYANTFIFAVYSWIHDVIKIPIDINILSLVLYGLMGLLIIFLLLVAYNMKNMTPLNLIQLVGAAILLSIVFSKFHSPQYFMWFAPLFAILVAHDIYKISVFLIVQLLAFIEFPILYGHFYTNVEYVNPVGSYGWYIPLVFFTIEYIFIFIMLHQNISETIKYNINKYILRGEKE